MATTQEIFTKETLNILINNLLEEELMDEIFAEDIEETAHEV